MRVKVVWRASKRQYVLRWHSAEGWREKTTGLSEGKRNRAEAERLASKLEAELAEAQPCTTEWDEFVSRFSCDRLAHLSKRYRSTWLSAIASMEAVVHPQALADVNADAIREWQAVLAGQGKSLSTVRTYTKHLMASLRWAQEVGLASDKAPKVKLPKLLAKMRSRPITGRELVRMMRAADKLRPAESKQWRIYLKGLWWSGLRLQESLDLGWTWDWPLTVDLTSHIFPVFAVYKQKSGHEQTLPMAPEFAKFLTKVRKRTGPVFELPSRDVNTVGKFVSACGREAQIRVSRGGKFATAHDLRRAFGTRWAQKLMPAELMVLMRHQSIQTTLTYYVAINTDDISRKLWRGFQQD